MAKPKCIVIDENLEKAAMEYVKNHGMKFSGLISVLLRKYLEEHGAKIESEYEQRG